jgi:hypothetical protein
LPKLIEYTILYCTCRFNEEKENGTKGKQDKMAVRNNAEQQDKMAARHNKGEEGNKIHRRKIVQEDTEQYWR